MPPSGAPILVTVRWIVEGRRRSSRTRGRGGRSEALRVTLMIAWWGSHVSVSPRTPEARDLKLRVFLFFEATAQSF
jgi:hypothetical protein